LGSKKGNDEHLEPHGVKTGAKSISKKKGNRSLQNDSLQVVRGTEAGTGRTDDSNYTPRESKKKRVVNETKTEVRSIDA